MRRNASWSPLADAVPSIGASAGNGRTSVRVRCDDAAVEFSAFTRRPTLEAERRLWQAAADLVAADLAATTPLRWELPVKDAPEGSSELLFHFGYTGDGLWEFDPTTVSALLPGGLTLAAVLAQHIADRVLEDVMTDLRRPWPECREHGWPMDPTRAGTTGTWQCPKDPAHVAPIGGLAASGLAVDSSAM